MPSNRTFCDLYARAIQKAVEEKLPVEIVYGRLVWKDAIDDMVTFFLCPSVPLKEAQEILVADGGEGKITHKMFWAVLNAVYDAKTKGMKADDS